MGEWIKKYKDMDMWEYWPEKRTMTLGYVSPNNEVGWLAEVFYNTFSEGMLREWNGGIRDSFASAKKAVEEYCRVNGY